MPQYKHPCPHCGNFIMRDVAVCPYCATPDPFTPGRCPQCSAPIEDPAWKVCPRCGTSLVAPAVEAPETTNRPAPGPGVGWRAPSAPVERIQQALGTAPGQARPGALWGSAAAQPAAPGAAQPAAGGATAPQTASPASPAEAGTGSPPPAPPPAQAGVAPPAAPAAASTCTACGAPLGPGARFCTVCGTLAG